ncbi:hypothetical protein FRB95_005613 [Tulasnella sp. JGI-2019a]|nr:hypothetical protein FRB95_005613 [Tulasnella sp. JGI-2019a]
MSTDLNTFSTRLCGLDNPQSNYQIDIPIRSKDVGLAVGLNSFDVSCQKVVRVWAYADKPTASSATIHVAAWLNTVVNSGGCTWLEVNKNDRDFQYGTFCTREDHPWDELKMQTVREITFDKPYAEAPKIVCWFNMIATEPQHNCRIRTYAGNITKTGFTLYISTWADTTRYVATATWIAHPANRTNISSGSYNTMDVQPLDEPQARCEGHLSFDKPFQKPPLVLTALNWLDIGGPSSVRIKTLNTNITEKGMTWHLDTWGDSILHSTGASYLAIQEY